MTQLAVQYQMLTQPEVLQLAHNRAQERRQHQAEKDPETDENNKTLTAVGQGLSYDYLVDLTARFSNPSDSDQEVEEDAFESTIDGFGGSRLKQKQRRLGETEILKLIAQYLEGGTINELASAWSIHRTTVMSHLSRQGVLSR